MAQLPVLPAPTPEINAAEKAFIQAHHDTNNIKLNNIVMAGFHLDNAYRSYFETEYAKNGKKYKPPLNEKSLQNMLSIAQKADSLKKIDNLKKLRQEMITDLNNLLLHSYRREWKDLHVQPDDIGAYMNLDLDSEKNGIPFNIKDYLNICSMFRRMEDTSSNEYVSAQLDLVNRLQKFELDDPIQIISILNHILPIVRLQHKQDVKELSKLASLKDTLKQDAFVKSNITSETCTQLVSILNLLANAHSKTGNIVMAQQFYKETIAVSKNIISLIPKDIGRINRKLIIIRMSVGLSKWKAVYETINAYAQVAQFNKGIKLIEHLLRYDPFFLDTIECRQIQINLAVNQGDLTLVKQLKKHVPPNKIKIKKRVTEHKLQALIDSKLIQNATKAGKLRHIEDEWVLIEAMIAHDRLPSAKTHLDEMTLIASSDTLYKPYYLKLMHLYAGMYRYNGQYIQAISYQIQYFNLKKQQLLEYSIGMAQECNKIAFMYYKNRQLDSAEFWYRKAFNICEKLDYQQGRMMYSLRLSSVAIDKKNYTLAEKLLQPAKDFFRNRDFDSLSGNQAELHSNLVKIMIAKQQFKKAHVYLNKVFLYRKAQVLTSSVVVQFFESIIIAENENRTEAMMSMLETWLALKRESIQNRFAILDDNAKTQFMESLDDEFSTIASVLSRSTQPNISSLFYDLALLQKGIVLSDIKNLQQSILRISDVRTRLKADSLLHFRKILSEQDDYKSLNDLKYRATVQQKVDSLQQFLKNTSFFRQDWANIHWRDVQNQLKENEVAIEIIDFQYHTPTVPTDSVVYYAAVLRKGDAKPTMLRLFEEKQLTVLLPTPPKDKDAYKIHFNNLYENSTPLYELIWKPFETAKLLKEGETVYLSASGQLNRVSLAALLNPLHRDKRFQDLYRLEMVNSTREIHVDANDKVLINNDLSALLVGGVRYESDSTAVIQAFQQQQAFINNPKELMVVRSLTPDIDSCNLNYLAGSLTEVQAIHAAIQTQKRVDATVLTGFSASEDIVRAQLKSAPTMLHLATHGGYTLPEKRKLTPMQALHNNFVLLAGCKRSTCERKPNLDKMEDGVLTAAEVADMDLKKTQLVVLSACETGLGDLRGREGVFGLARGFKLAGAKYQLVSLWQVPDAETAAFMQLFYQKCLNGTAIQDAFLETQAVLRTQYPDAPYKWAAWVLIR